MTHSNIEGILLDLNGVLYEGQKLLAGAEQIIEKLKTSGKPFRFITNTTTISHQTLASKLQQMGLPITSDQILSPAQATISWLKKHHKKTVHLVLEDDLKSEFKDFTIAHTNPDAIIIGDIGERWNFKIMNKLFEMLVYGADLIALHKGRYWQKDGELHLDVGAIIAGLEYAAGRPAIVIGKPSASFYEIALDLLGLPAHKVVMVGDDIDSDIGGAQAIGMQGILVKTGKYREVLHKNSSIRPDHIINTITDLDKITGLL